MSGNKMSGNKVSDSNMFSKWWLAVRPKTLVAGVSPILLGSLIALPIGKLDNTILFTAHTCALLLQIAVNFANDLFDGLSGVDTDERLGPQRAVQSGLIPANQMKIALAATSFLAMVSGLYLVFVGGWLFLVLGIFSLLGVFAYSAGPKPLASMGLGELTVFIFFGLVAVLGSYYLQAQPIPWYGWLLASNTGLFASAILLVNNIRDIPTDIKAGKLTLAARLGSNNARKLLALMLIAPLVLHLLLIPTKPLMLIAVIICLLPVFKLVKAGFSFEGRALNELLAKVAAVNFIYCLASVICWQFSYLL